MTAHLYKHLEKQKAWKILDKALKKLIANGDIAPLTPREYIVGYILEQLQPEGHHASFQNGVNASSSRIPAIKKNSTRTRRHAHANGHARKYPSTAQAH